MNQLARPHCPRSSSHLGSYGWRTFFVAKAHQPLALQRMVDRNAVLLCERQANLFVLAHVGHYSFGGYRHAAVTNSNHLDGRG